MAYNAPPISRLIRHRNIELRGPLRIYVTSFDVKLEPVCHKLRRCSRPASALARFARLAAYVRPPGRCAPSDGPPNNALLAALYLERPAASRRAPFTTPVRQHSREGMAQGHGRTLA